MFLAETATRVGVGNGLAHDVDQVAVFAADVDESDLRPNREARNHHAFDDRVRIVLQDQTVLAGAGLAFVAVAEDVLGFRRFLGHERPFHAGGKSGAAAPAQVRCLDLVDDPVRTQRERLLQRLVAVELDVAVNVGRTLPEALGNHAYFVGMGNQVTPFVIGNW